MCFILINPVTIRWWFCTNLMLIIDGVDTSFKNSWLFSCVADSSAIDFSLLLVSSSHCNVTFLISALHLVLTVFLFCIWFSSFTLILRPSFLGWCVHCFCFSSLNAFYDAGMAMNQSLVQWQQVLTSMLFRTLGSMMVSSVF